MVNYTWHRVSGANLIELWGDEVRRTYVWSPKNMPRFLDALLDEEFGKDMTLVPYENSPFARKQATLKDFYTALVKKGLVEEEFLENGGYGSEPGDMDILDGLRFFRVYCPQDCDDPYGFILGDSEEQVRNFLYLSLLEANETEMRETGKNAYTDEEIDRIVESVKPEENLLAVFNGLYDIDDIPNWLTQVGINLNYPSRLC